MRKKCAVQGKTLTNHIEHFGIIQAANMQYRELGKDGSEVETLVESLFSNCW